MMGKYMADNRPEGALKSKDMVLVEFNGKSMKLPVWIQAGHPDNSVTVFLGYGRTRAGRSGTGAGVRCLSAAYQRRRRGSRKRRKDHARPTELTYLPRPRAIRRWTRATASVPSSRRNTLEEYKKEANFDEDKTPRRLTLYPPFDYKSQPTRGAWRLT